MARTKRPPIELGMVDKIVAIAEIAALVILVALNIMAARGLSLVRGELYSFVAMLIPLLLLGWIGYRIVRRFEKRRTKLIVGTVIALVMMILFTVVMSYISVVATMTVPQKVTAIRSPSGKHQLLVMRAMDLDEERIEQRRAARLAADPEADPETQAADYGYQYLAFPPALGGFFYRNDADLEGIALIGYSSAAELMVEWLEDEEVAHFFVKNPEVADGGEFTVRFTPAG